MELADALAARRAMEEQLREGYKVAAMGTLGGGFSGEIRRALEPIGALSREGLDRSAPGTEESNQWERVADLANGGLAIVRRMTAFGDGGMRDTEAITAADGLPESVSLATEEADTTLQVAFRMDDETSRIRVNRWELHEVGAQLIASAVEAMGADGRERRPHDCRCANGKGAGYQGRKLCPRPVRGYGAGNPDGPAGARIRALVHDQGGGGRKRPRSCHRLQPGARVERGSDATIRTRKGRDLRDPDPDRRRGPELTGRPGIASLRDTHDWSLTEPLRGGALRVPRVSRGSGLRPGGRRVLPARTRGHVGSRDDHQPTQFAPRRPSSLCRPG